VSREGRRSHPQLRKAVNKNGTAKTGSGSLLIAMLNFSTRRENRGPPHHKLCDLMRLSKVASRIADYRRRERASVRKFLDSGCPGSHLKFLCSPRAKPSSKNQISDRHPSLLMCRLTNALVGAAWKKAWRNHCVPKIGTPAIVAAFARFASNVARGRPVRCANSK